MVKWNEVTWYSRLGAIILFTGVLPVLSFYIGMQYQLTISNSDEVISFLQEMDIESSAQNQSIATTTVPVPADIPAGWKTYRNGEWGIAFAYPSNWSLTEDWWTQEENDAGTGRAMPVGGLQTIKITGDGYTFEIPKISAGELQEGKEYSRFTYTIGNRTAHAAQLDEGTGFWLSISIYVDKTRGFVFRISHKSSKSKEVIEKIFSTFSFY